MAVIWWWQLLDAKNSPMSAHGSFQWWRPSGTSSFSPYHRQAPEKELLIIQQFSRKICFDSNYRWLSIARARVWVFVERDETKSTRGNWWYPRTSIHSWMESAQGNNLIAATPSYFPIWIFTFGSEPSAITKRKNNRAMNHARVDVNLDWIQKHLTIVIGITVVASGNL